MLCYFQLNKVVLAIYFIILWLVSGELLLPVAFMNLPFPSDKLSEIGWAKIAKCLTSEDDGAMLHVPTNVDCLLRSASIKLYMLKFFFWGYYVANHVMRNQLILFPGESQCFPQPQETLRFLEIKINCFCWE